MTIETTTHVEDLRVLPELELAERMMIKAHHSQWNQVTDCDPSWERYEGRIVLANDPLGSGPVSYTCQFTSRDFSVLLSLGREDLFGTDYINSGFELEVFRDPEVETTIINSADYVAFMVTALTEGLWMRLK